MRKDKLAKLACSAVALLAGGLSPAGAQTMNYGSLEALFGEPVTTSATGSPQKASDAPVTLDIVTADEIKRSGASNVAEIIGRLAGVNVSQGGAQDYNVAIRGFNEPWSGRLLVLVDGRQAYQDFYGFTDWAALPVRLEEIQQIEVVKGPNTALFGFNAAAGVVNIVTKNPGFDPVNAATIRYGSDNTREASGTASYKFADGSGIKLSGGYSSTDELQYSAFDTRPTTGANKYNTGTPSVYTLDAQGIAKLGESTQVMAEGTKTLHVYNATISPGYNLSQSQNDTYSFRGEVTSSTPIGLVTGQVYENKSIFNIGNILPIDETLIVGQVQDLFQIGDSTTMRVSGEYRDNSMLTTPTQPSGTVGYKVWSGSVMGERKLSSSYTLTGAVRYDSLTLDRTGPFPLGVPQTDSQWNRTLGEVSYNVGLVGQVAADHTLRLTTARGLQLPNLIDLGGLAWVVAGAPAPVYTGAVLVGNPNLNATVVTNYELGWDWAMSDTAKLRSSVYYERNTNFTAVTNNQFGPPDLLYARPPFPPLAVDEAVPFGSADVKGIEIAFSNSIAGGIRYGINGTALKVSETYLIGAPARRIAYDKTTPKFEGNGNLGWTGGPWSVDGYLKMVSQAQSFVGGRVDNLGGKIRLTMFTVSAHPSMDFRIGYKIQSNVTLAVEGRNLFEGNTLDQGGMYTSAEGLVALRADF